MQLRAFNKTWIISRMRPKSGTKQINLALKNNDNVE